MRARVAAITVAVAVAVAATASACGRGGSRGDPIPRLAHQLPATARAVIAIDGARVRGTWLAGSAPAFRALVPADRACLIDAALAADRALVAELATGRIVVLATDATVTCRALSRVGPGVWLATLDGATAPAANEPRLDARPDFAELAAALTAPIAAVAPDGVPDAGVVFAAAAIASPTHGELTFELDSADRAERADAWLHGELAGLRPVLGGASAVIDTITVARAGPSVTVTADGDRATMERDGPVAIVAVVAALAARRAPPAIAIPPTCLATRWPVQCTDGTRFTFAEASRTLVADAVREAHPAPRVAGGMPAGVRLGEIPADGVLAALGLRTGDAVIAVDRRQLDTKESIDDLAKRLETARAIAITIERGPATFELHYQLTRDP